MAKSLDTLRVLALLGLPKEARRSILSLDEWIDFWAMELLQGKLRVHYGPFIKSEAAPLRTLLRPLQRAREVAKEAVVKTRLKGSRLEPALNGVAAGLTYQLDRLDEAAGVLKRTPGLRASDISCRPKFVSNRWSRKA